MKPLTKKILESGLVDAHAARLFRRWGSLDDMDVIGQIQIAKKMIIGDFLEEFIDDLENLLEKEKEFKETRLGMVVKPPKAFHVVGMNLSFYASEDEMGRLIVDKDNPVTRGTVLVAVGVGMFPEVTVLDVELIWSGDSVVAKQLTIRKE